MARSHLTVRSTVASSLALAAAAVPVVALQAPAQAVEAGTPAANVAATNNSQVQELAQLTPFERQSVTTEINLPSGFGETWKVRTNGDASGQYTANKITATAQGFVAYENASLLSAKAVGFANGASDSPVNWVELGTAGTPITIANGTVEIPLLVSVGEMYKTFTVTAPYSADGVQSVSLPQNIIDEAAAQGLELAGTTVTVRTAKTELGEGVERMPAMCWTPSTKVANKIDIENSRGIARVGNTFVIPAGIVVDDQGASKRVKLAAHVALKGDTFQGKINGLEMDVRDEGYGMISTALYGYLGVNNAAGIPQYQKTQSPLLSTMADMVSDSNWNFAQNSLAEVSASTQVLNSFGSPLAGEANDFELGNIDISCAQHTTELQTGYAQLLGEEDATFSNVEFSDVNENSAFAAEIIWAGNNGVLRGYNDGTFRPNEDISREAMAAVLYRMAGSPEFSAPLESPFKDIPTFHPFYNEIAWMHSQGITTGYADGTYRPGQPVNRDAMAAFFYRFAGSPDFAAPATSPFTDLGATDQFYKEISWLASTKITTGWEDGTYRPLSAVQRNAMAAFAYRYNENVQPLVINN